MLERQDQPRGTPTDEEFPLTVRGIRDAIHGLDYDVEIIFGWTCAAKKLRFHRFKWRGEKLLQIELNEEE